MIDWVQAEIQIKRLGQLENYPKFEPAAEQELVATAVECAPSLERLLFVVTDYLRRETKAPFPSELRRLLSPEHPDVEPRIKGPCPHGRCDGSGWAERFFLVTIEGGSKFAFKDRKPITKEQFQTLSRKVDHQTQECYMAVAKCSCVGGAA